MALFKPKYILSLGLALSFGLVGQLAQAQSPTDQTRTSDKDAKPILGFPPSMPRGMTKSGHCKLKYDVSSDGAPYNIKTTFCTEERFARPSIKSVSRWRYNPKIVNGRKVARIGVESKVTFRLVDENGEAIPE